MQPHFRYAALPLLLGSALALSGCGKPPAPVEKPRPVKLLTVDAGATQGRVELAGEIRARVESPLGFRVAGKIISRQVEAGQRVRKGDVLARLDPRDYTLASSAAASQVDAAKADLDLARAEYKRFQELRSQQFVSDLDLDRKRVAVSAAEARLKSLQSQSSLETNRVEDAILRADADGVITQLHADAGQVVAAGQPVVSLAQDGPRDIAVEFPEDRTKAARLPGATAALWAQPQKQYAATLRELSAVADPVTRTFRARYSVDAPVTALALGQSATLTIPLPSQQGGIRLPTTALVGDHNISKVWQFDPASGKLRGVPVQVVGIEGNEVLVSGLQPGAKIVTAGVHVLSEGQVVRPLGEAAR
ncbi:MAG TPA: efflux RND transporter periplasmic adaptor subunit [Fluviicoccus sp.]|nr:efflux RND transporter periplasmic adaptor subunit [Fluviicoccus sp.]